MVTAKCMRCGGAAIGSTFTEASAKINHAVGLSRGIKCGNNYNKVQEVKEDKPVKIDDSKKEKIEDTKKETIPKQDSKLGKTKKKSSFSN